MAQELVVQTFSNAIQEQVPILIKATGLNQQELQSKLISFAYATKGMLDKANISLANLDPNSIREAFKASLDTGIPVDKRQLAYIVKYGNKIEYQIGFKGFISRIKEIYPTASVKAELVYEGDIFNVEKIDGQARYTHKLKDPFASSRKMTGVYAFVQYTDKGKEYSFIETMSREEVDKIKGKAKTAYVWNEWYGEMAKKAVIRRLCKTLFIGDPKIAIMEDIDNKSFDIQQEPVHIDYDQAQPMPEEIQPNRADVIAEQEQVVEQEIKNDTATEGAFDTMYMLEKIEKKAGKTKSGRDYVLNILHLEGGLIVKTFDDKPYEAGQTVELIEWDKEKGQCKRVNIL
ncbi:MAG: recombinase RecT [Clostridia bacterium]|nr:recombinase RecT [Clostridia bacterium]